MNLENIENKRKRLIYRSWHRGTKEMDLIMGSFADKNVPDFSESEVAMYEALLEQNDPDLYEWITGQKEAPANVVNDVYERLKCHRLV
jgi:antitoxin CptB